MLPKTVMQSSIVGDRVAVEIGDGYYAPAIIKSMRTDSSSSETTSECIYTVCFDDGKSKYCTGDEIIGSSFKSITDIKLQPYQKVYTVYKGCEVSGYVLSCDSEKVKIQLPGFTEKEVVERTLNELYLFTNRWDQTSTSQSQYNVDNIGNPDNMTSEDRSPCKDGRAISASIKVPQSTGRVRKTSEEPTMTELIAAMVLSNLSCSPVFHHPPMLNNPQTNLGTSPQSLDSSGVGSWSSRHISPTRHSNNPTVVVGTPGGGCGGGGVVDHHRLTPSDEPSDDDVNMILIDRSTPTPKGGSKSSQDEMQDEPQDLRVPRVNVVRPSSYKDSEPMEAKEVGTAASTSQHNTTAPIPFPVVLSNYPYYFPPNVVPHPLATSLPPDFRFQLSSLPPHPSVMTITRSPPPQQQQRQSDGTGSVVVSVAGSVGHSDGKMSHRHHHRPTPYHKVAEEALLSAAGSAGSSPSSSKPVHPSTQHSQYYPFQSSPVPIASLSFSPTHHVKQHSRSHLVAASPTSRSTLSPSSSQQLSHSSNERTSPLAIPTAGGGYAVYESRCQPRITPVMGASGPINIATAKAFSWQNECSPAAFSPKPSIVHQRQQIHQLASPKMGFPMSPKPLQIGRKVRGDGKKCRKVYGMERRDLWCTSCRWKKACQRFPD